MKKHLAIFSPEVIKQIFNGSKTIESRFSQQRIPPFGTISVGDIVYIKPPGEDIKGQFTVKKVISFENLDHGDWQVIKTNFGRELSLGDTDVDERYFQSKLKARYGTLIFMDQIEQFLTSPLKIVKKDLRGWVVLTG